MEFQEHYLPLTAAPFRDREIYREVLPQPALRPWIRCFWEFRGGEVRTLVTPDTCMDIIFDLDERAGALFCGIDDTTVWTQAGTGEQADQFAVRFYPWAAAIFAEDSLRDGKNLRCPAQAYFPTLVRELRETVRQGDTLEKRAALAERWLIGRLNVARTDADVLQACWEIVLSRGGIRMDALSRSLHISPRQLERRFREHMGIGPKKLSGLIRYQNVWRDVLTQPRFDILDAVVRYGYTDQAHLLNDFKKYHLLSLGDARAYAYGNLSLFYKTKP